jgi:hypothetical protein
MRVLDDDNIEEFFCLMASGLDVREAWREFMGEGVPLSDEDAARLEMLYDQSSCGIEAPRQKWEHDDARLSVAAARSNRAPISRRCTK